MKSIIGYIVVITALVLLMLVDRQTSEASDGTGSAYYSSAVTGASFSSNALNLKSKSQKRLVANNNKLAVWPERILKVKHRNYLLAQAFAIKADDYKKEMGKYLAKKDDFIVFAAEDESRFDGFFVTLNKLPVVINETDGELGVVTGNVIVKVKSPEVAGLVASGSKSEIISVNDLKKTATLKLPFDQDLTELIHAIRNHSGVESADFQIVSKGTKISGYD